MGARRGLALASVCAGGRFQNAGLGAGAGRGAVSFFVGMAGRLACVQMPGPGPRGDDGDSAGAEVQYLEVWRGHNDVGARAAVCSLAPVPGCDRVWTCATGSLLLCLWAGGRDARSAGPACCLQRISCESVFARQAVLVPSCTVVTCTDGGVWVGSRNGEMALFPRDQHPDRSGGWVAANDASSDADSADIRGASDDDLCALPPPERARAKFVYQNSVGRVKILAAVTAECGPVMAFAGDSFTPLDPPRKLRSARRGANGRMPPVQRPRSLSDPNRASAGAGAGAGVGAGAGAGDGKKRAPSANPSRRESYRAQQLLFWDIRAMEEA